MSFDPINSARVSFCNQCQSKPVQPHIAMTKENQRIMFCSMKCMQSYKIKAAMSLNKYKVSDLKIGNAEKKA